MARDNELVSIRYRIERVACIDDVERAPFEQRERRPIAR